MRIDVITIFPEYLAPLELSLIGKARKDGLIDVHLHNLRDYTHDRHRTVDDTPVGGGAGMVMKPEPWAEAFADVLASGRGESDDGSASPLVIFPNPAGEPFTQRAAEQRAEEPWLI
ncbi:MAG: tRNA (guanosine(37)-N1)-methyltransferase TrmD, partial [Dermabacter sp.]|nr:tRNA (guanosine(37)-N1)-methyltransferase TrmD [Dermabacter sp.]